MGVRLTQVRWTIGNHDIVAVAEADDDQTAAAAFLALGSQGNLRTTSLRAFSRDEMEGSCAASADAAGNPRSVGNTRGFGRRLPGAIA